MGKLHTLKRAIQRDPDKWYFPSNQIAWTLKYKKPHDYVWNWVNGARFDKGEWIPYKYNSGYSKFVKSVLREMGYTDLIW